MSKVILQNVKVLAVGKELEVNERNRNQANPVTVATLLVNPEESEKLALSATEGRLMLTLRSWTDNQAVITGGMNASTLLTDSSTKPRDAVVVVAAPLRRGPLRVAQAAPAPPPPPVAPNSANGRKDVVEILRGDRFEERKFEAKDKQ
jgi:pilus assembly protein CpaB